MFETITIKKNVLDFKPPQLTSEQLEEARVRLQVLNQISLNHGAVPVQAQVGKDGKIISITVEEKKK
ncbi:MAG: hypothetical protein UR39_C0002G0136 [Candidatus Woesebacteria bacterium GW2011_GWA1_33_30]|uniref:Uncharacterized protein n=1 Tax=Candidatus Woesebacteria bacterium GW2011_GWA2_33_28 TaxID=1618561 RepID=A0A0F9ZUI3_9BACT|nr:MAG: hypothetical protein UR38_C0002G0136 [Candidatus Woesebacteria bacterium GW2011_GWA2_33_28]KKP48846.1 MAG: hypothetical protein UR39_C0002G0136 [Candidatus Woesebacteria bacterium GW2011_GWA1_33_30]KKP50119.1 MAG: hypothetical protein UR40_C0002G0136 [Microgenomates group bacterium GW2011_GWC1_33_32]KKP51889.1 MAG: hypothetical protein UR44_C0006G0135 [Candidatus Woesebacteria bacterium GW2011_GWB1_33_38]KKP57388.1 MAG: hypothetical protein UR48_C0018G0006 [Microgenomates group bacteriu